MICWTKQNFNTTLRNVNFDVFGDFVIRFPICFRGLNALIFGMDDLKNSINTEMYADVDGQLIKGEDGSKAQISLIQQKTNQRKPSS